VSVTLRVVATPVLSPAPVRREEMTTITTRLQTVLVVEDDDTTREAVAQELRDAGYGVAEADNGREALDCVAGHAAPDAILLDMMLPVLDGWGVLERLRRTYPAVPVVVTTAAIISREWALQHGCAGFVKKPIDAGRLVEEIRRCC
jgi:CheY-like chemotaxis protein